MEKLLMPKEYWHLIRLNFISTYKYIDMNFEDRLERFVLLNHLILSGRACSVKVLSEKLGLSPRRVKDLIAYLKGKGAPIVYDRTQKKFVYEDEGHFEIKFEYISGKKSRVL